MVFGEGDDRYDMPKQGIRFAAANVPVDLPFSDIVKWYNVDRNEPLPSCAETYEEVAGDVDLEAS
ncbi:MAG TPA: hypothetical protein VHA09_00810 [Nitrososphaera sp.]|nr:hypothetical protein [Nitrososphaera sp.]